MYLSDPLDEFAVITTLIGLFLGGYFAYKATRTDRDGKIVLEAFDKAIPRLKFVFAFSNILLYPLIIKVILGLYYPIPALSGSSLSVFLGLLGLGLIWISICSAAAVYVMKFILIHREQK